MKKYLLTFAMGLLLALALAPAAFAADVTDEVSLNNAISNGGTINLQNDISISNTVSIQKAVTINGNGHKITYTNTAQSYAFSVETNEAVTFENVVIDATASNVMNGITVNSNCVPNLTLDKATLNVTRWGLAFNPNGPGARLTVKNDSVIKNTQVSNYELEAVHGDYRGISVWDADNAVITISDSEILGFQYTINVCGASLVGNNTNIDFDIDNSNLWGWCAFNIWTIGNHFEITNSDLRGINTWNGGANNFGTIVLNSGIYGSSTDSNVFDIYGGSIGSYEQGTNSQWPINIADELRTKFNFYLDSNDNLVAFYFDAGSAPINFAGAELSESIIENYLSNYVSGLDNCEFYVASNNAAYSLYSY